MKTLISLKCNIIWNVNWKKKSWFRILFIYISWMYLNIIEYNDLLNELSNILQIIIDLSISYDFSRKYKESIKIF